MAVFALANVLRHPSNRTTAGFLILSDRDTFYDTWKMVRTGGYGEKLSDPDKSPSSQRLDLSKDFNLNSRRRAGIP